MRTISDTVIILSQELFVTSGTPVRKKQTNVSLWSKNFLQPRANCGRHTTTLFGKQCKYINHLPKVLTQFEKAAKEQCWACWTKVGFFIVKSSTHCICFLTQPLFFKSDWALIQLLPICSVQIVKLEWLGQGENVKKLYFKLLKV